MLVFEVVTQAGTRAFPMLVEVWTPRNHSLINLYSQNKPPNIQNVLQDTKRSEPVLSGFMCHYLSTRKSKKV